MKRLILFAVSLAVITMMVVGLTGCGGDTSKAKEYMNTADQMFSDLESAATEFQTTMTSLSSQLSNPDTLTAAVKSAKDAGTVLAGKIDETRAAYEKIKTLNGVDDYVAYADLMIGALDVETELLNSMNDFFNQVTTLSSDPNALMQLQSTFLASVQTKQEEASKLLDDAQKLKTDKNL